MTRLGRLLYRVRAGEKRSPLASLVAPHVITLRSSAFSHGEPMPRSCAGNGVGEDISPPLRWTGLPAGTQQVVLVIDDPVPHHVATTEALLAWMRGALLGRGMLTGTYQR